MMLPVPVPDPRQKFLPIPDPTRGYTLAVYVVTYILLGLLGCDGSPVRPGRPGAKSAPRAICPARTEC